MGTRLIFRDQPGGDGLSSLYELIGLFVQVISPGK